MTTLTLAEKLQFLWDDFIVFINDGVKENKYPKEILQNFKFVDKRQLKKMSDNAKYSVNCTDCKNNCCSRIEGKVLLTLKDLAILIDNGHKDAIEGSFSGFAALLSDYQKNRDTAIFNDVNILMQDTLNNQYMPYLKKAANVCTFLDKEGRCAIYDIMPRACKSYPYVYDAKKREIAWSENCNSKSSAVSEKEKDDAIRSVIESENERIRDISLIMLNSENLAKIGFKEYL